MDLMRCSIIGLCMVALVARVYDVVRGRFKCWEFRHLGDRIVCILPGLERG